MMSLAVASNEANALAKAWGVSAVASAVQVETFDQCGQERDAFVLDGQVLPLREQRKERRDRGELVATEEREVAGGRADAGEVLEQREPVVRVGSLRVVETERSNSAGPRTGTSSPVTA